MGASSVRAGLALAAGPRRLPVVSHDAAVPPAQARRLGIRGARCGPRTGIARRIVLTRTEALMTIDEAFASAVEHHQAGRLREAEALYRQVVANAPNHADASHLLGVVAYQSGHLQP